MFIYSVSGIETSNIVERTKTYSIEHTENTSLLFEEISLSFYMFLVIEFILKATTAFILTSNSLFSLVEMKWLYAGNDEVKCTSNEQVNITTKPIQDDSIIVVQIKSTWIILWCCFTLILSTSIQMHALAQMDIETT